MTTETQPASAAPRRRADAARNDLLLWDTGLRLLIDKGPDRLSALDLARSAGLTTGAVYARYENNEEILVGLWQNRIAGPLREYLSQAVEVMTSPYSPDTPAADDDSDLARRVFDPESPLSAGISMLIVAPRIIELSEFIIPEVQSWLREFGVTDVPGDPESSTNASEPAITSGTNSTATDTASLKILSAVSAALGVVYFAAADMFPRADWRRMILGVQYANQVEGLEPILATLPPVEARPPFNYTITTDNEVRDALVNAAANVIARSGTERATTQRIARAAGLPPSALFAEYQNRQALFHDVATKLLTEIYSRSRYAAIHGVTAPGVTAPGVTAPGVTNHDLTISGNSPEKSHDDVQLATDYDDPRLKLWRESMVTSVAENTFGLLGSVGSLHRRLRLEFQLAAIHDDDVRAELQRIDQQTVGDAGEFYLRAFGISSDLARRSTRFLRTIAQGAMLLEEVSHAVTGRDVRLINARLAEYVSRRAIGEIEPTTARP